MVDNQERASVSEKILHVIKELQDQEGAWVDFARMGAPLNFLGVQYKEYGFPKLRPFLNEFQDVLEFKDELVEGKPPVCYVRPKAIGTEAEPVTEPEAEVAQKIVPEAEAEVPKVSAEEPKAHALETDAPKREMPVIQQSSDKPPFRDGKHALMAVGFVNDAAAAIKHLSQRLGVEIKWDELDYNLRTAYAEGRIRYYEYDAEGNVAEAKRFSPKTAAFAIETGYLDQDGHRIYAQYNKNNQGWMGVFFNTKRQMYNIINSYKIGRLTFKNYSEANAFIESLQGELLPGETWKYAEPARNGMRKKTTYEILESYLRTVLAALMLEHQKEDSLNYGKIKFSSDGNYALFNTGLLSKYATDVIIIGEIYPKKGKEVPNTFFISNPTVLKGGKTELLSKKFKAEDADVDMVSFFEKVSQIVYDATVEVDTDDITRLYHCIEEGIKRDRFPEECKEQYERGDIEELTDDFTKAIRRAERIARRNYKYVVPQYRTTSQGNSIQFLMPIYMQSRYDESPDFALVLSEQILEGQKFYKPETVLELAWAYNNARVISKPDDLWLDPDKIEDSSDDDEEIFF